MSSPRTVAYLESLGLEPDLPPSLESLRAIHRRHVQQVPYENLDIMLGAPPSVLPGDSLTRVAHPGRAGPFTFDIDRLDDDGWSFPTTRPEPSPNPQRSTRSACRPTRSTSRSRGALRALADRSPGVGRRRTTLTRRGRHAEFYRTSAIADGTVDTAPTIPL